MTDDRVKLAVDRACKLSYRLESLMKTFGTLVDDSYIEVIQVLDSDIKVLVKALETKDADLDALKNASSNLLEVYKEVEGHE